MWELQEQIEQMVDQYFEDASAIRVSAESVGLDARAGYLFISTEEGWIASRNTGSLEYYGGFEYIGEEYKMTVGEITFYSKDHSRVADALEYYNALQEQQGKEDAAIRIPDNNGLR
jgi:hypothetical protein